MDQSLSARLARVRRRIADAVPYSPEWAAAIDELEELEAAVPGTAEHGPVPAPLRTARTNGEASEPESALSA